MDKIKKHTVARETENPYKTLEAKTDYEKFLKKELIDLHDAVNSTKREIEHIDPLKEKRKILSDALKTEYITKEQYKTISEKLKDDPKDFDVIKAIQKINKKYKGSSGKGIESDILEYLKQF